MTIKKLTGEKQSSTNEAVEMIMKGLNELCDLLEGVDDDSDYVWEDSEGNKVQLTLNEKMTETRSVMNCQVKYTDSGKITIEADLPRS